MATWDSADLLATFHQKANLPTSSVGLTDTLLYTRLAKSQNRVIAYMAPVVPSSLYPKVAYGSLPTLTTTDNQVYTFGSDASSYPIFPMGKGGIFASLNDIPGFPLRPGIDYMVEGSQIRAPYNGTLPATLYWYGISQPADIASGTQPALFPEASRELIVIDAVRQLSKEGMRNAELAAAMTEEWNEAWPQWCLVWRTQYRNGGAVNAFTGLQLAELGAYQGI